MKATKDIVSLKAAVAAIVVGVLAGCGSSDKRDVQAPPAQVSASPAKSAQGASASMAASSARSFRQDLVASQQQVDQTLASLKALTDPATTDLRTAYDGYSNQLARTTEHAEKLRREANSMRDARNAYFAQWEEKVSDIDNPTIRASAEARRAKLRGAHEKIVSSAGQAKDAYEPFMRDLQDVRKFLGGDLSKQSVSMLGEVQKKAEANGATVKQKLGAIVSELDAIEAGVH